MSALEAFHTFYGHPALGEWSAPGRVNLIGEHTDYNDGFVFPFAIDRRTHVALSTRADRLIRVASAFSNDPAELHIDEISPEKISGWSAYVFGVVWAFAEFGASLGEVAGVDLYVTSDVPVGAGLSSSAAIECAVALALNEHWSLGFDRETLARIGQLAENRVVGAPTGIMDQSASLLGKTDHGVFLDCRSLEAEVIPLGLARDDLAILVIDTHVEHAHASGGYASRRASCEAGAAALGVSSLRDLSVKDLERAERELDNETFRRVRHVITENQRVLDTVRRLHENGATSIGPLLDASHVSMRDDFEISVPQLDLAVETAQATGAIGARMTGGGFGGAAIALTTNALVPVLEQRIRAAFAERGYTEPTIFTVLPSAGAHRD